MLKATSTKTSPRSGLSGLQECWGSSSPAWPAGGSPSATESYEVAQGLPTSAPLIMEGFNCCAPAQRVPLPTSNSYFKAACITTAAPPGLAPQVLPNSDERKAAVGGGGGGNGDASSSQLFSLAPLSSTTKGWVLLARPLLQAALQLGRDWNQPACLL